MSITQRICHQQSEPNWYGSEKQTGFDCINNYTQHIAIFVFARPSLTCFMTGWLTNSRGISMATMIFDFGTRKARTATGTGPACHFGRTRPGPDCHGCHRRSLSRLPVPPRSRWAGVIMMVRGQADSDSLAGPSRTRTRRAGPPSRGAGLLVGWVRRTPRRGWFGAEPGRALAKAGTGSLSATVTFEPQSG